MSDSRAGGREWGAQALPPLLLAGGVFFCFFKPLFFGISFQDPTAFHYDVPAEVPSTIYMVREMFAHGRWPLWIANQSLGSPELGLLLPGLAYPLTLLLVRFEPGFTLALYSFVNTELIALFGFLLFRRCGASGFASAAAGFLLALSGFVPWVSLVYPCSFPLPWVYCWLWSAMGLAGGLRFRDWAWNTAAAAMLLVSGDAQMSVQEAYLLPLWYVLWLWRSGSSAGRMLRVLAALCLSAAAAFLLTALQLLPAGFCFSQVLSLRTPTLTDFAATFPEFKTFLLGLLGLFSRRFQNLFLPLSLLALFLAALLRQRHHPALAASVILGGGIALLVAAGRSGLAWIPFHLPFLKHFIRHYKLAIILQGPVFIGVALGFDFLVTALRKQERPWILLSALCFLFSLPLLPNAAWRAALVLAGTIIFLCLRNPKLHRLLPLTLAGFIMIDVASYAWQTPHRLSPPPPDPTYLSIVKKLGPHGRIQGMYSWIHRAGAGFPSPQKHGWPAAAPADLLPPHGNGYYGEHTMDSWLEFPLRNLAYFLYAISPAAAKIENGDFSRVDFVGPFKSSDFITPQNRGLVNLAALRYFFLLDMALSESDRFPLLSDPAYFADPARPHAFAPFRRRVLAAESCPPRQECREGRPYLLADRPGCFEYQTVFRPGDRLSMRLIWGAEAEETKTGHGAWATLIGRESGQNRLLLGRFLASSSSGTISLDHEPAAKTPLPVGLAFSALPPNLASRSADPPQELFAAWWLDPQIVNPARTIRYRGGDKLMVFENEEALGRARVVHRGRRVTGNAAAVEIMRDPEKYDPRHETLILSPGTPALAGGPPSPAERPLLLSYHHDEVQIRARLLEPGYLVLADSYYPGWRAFDHTGKEIKIFRADLAFRGLLLPKGEHLLTFRFLPSDFRLGLFITLASLLGLALAGLRRRSSEQEKAGN